VLCHLRSNNWYITRRSGHHYTNTTPEQEQRTQHNTPPHRPLGRGEHNKSSTLVSLSPTICHGETAARCKPKRGAGPPPPPPRAPPPRDRHPRAAHPTIESSYPEKEQHITPSRHQGKPLVVATLRGGPRHTHRPTLLCQGHRYLRPQREYLLRPSLTKVTTSQPRRLKTSSTRGPLCATTATRTRSTTCSTGQTSNGKGLQLRRLQGGHDVRVPPSHVQRRTRSSPESPARRTTRCFVMMPPAGRATPKSAATMPTDKHVSGGFQPNSHHARRTHATKADSSNPTPPQHLHCTRPGAIENTTTTPPTRVSQPLAPPPRQRHPSNDEERTGKLHHGRPWPTEAGRGQPWPTEAGRGRPRPTVASTGRSPTPGTPDRPPTPPVPTEVADTAGADTSTARGSKPPAAAGQHRTVAAQRWPDCPAIHLRPSTQPWAPPLRGLPDLGRGGLDPRPPAAAGGTSVAGVDHRAPDGRARRGARVEGEKAAPPPSSGSRGHPERPSGGGVTRRGSRRRGGGARVWRLASPARDDARRWRLKIQYI
jgi:hypothetical protein